MPAVRDYTFAFESLTTDAGITIPMCAHEANDLLLVFAMGDTGAGTWGCAGYTQLFAQNNTCSAVCYYKIAASSSEADVIVTNTVNETYNGCVIAIRDVNTTNPFGSPAVSNNQAQAGAAKFAMQQITTNVANALAIAVSFNSGAGVPSFIEGAITGLIGADGSAESMGVGWMFRPTAGLTPAVQCSNVAAGAGVKAVIQIAPPAGGATIIPTHCVADLSTYINPIHGSSAYNGDTGLSATADTNFGASIGGTTANDATVASAADVGVNSFHSMGQLTNAAVANTISGAEVILAAANRFALGVKNLLCHIRPSSPGQYQRLAPIASPRGVFIGVRSNTGSGGASTGYKVWKVHGVGTNWPLDATLPIVINNGAGNTKGTSGTLDAAVIAAIGFWTSSIGALTSAVQFGSLWLMDLCTLAGGNAAQPIDIPGIVSAAARGHERLSCIQQGATQMLCLQNIKFGDGGTNPIFLDLNSTAIEFPRQYSLAKKDVFYNGVDNTVGFTYHAGATDTIKHRDSVVSSPSKFHWRIDAASSASATYDFSGLSLIGAGDVQLRAVTTFSDMSFTNCLTIVQNSAVISNTKFSRSQISMNNPGLMSGCSHTSGGAGTGHAITITTPGTYTFSANTFTGYGAGGSTDAAIYNNSGGAVTLNVTSGGTVPTIRNGAGASTTVNATKTLTLTGLVAGSDIVILAAGTETERVNVDANAGATYAFVYTTLESVDVTVYKAGHVPFTIRNYALAATDASLPINQVLDRNYLP